MTINKGLGIALMGVLFFSSCSQNKTGEKVETAIDTQTIKDR